MVDKKQNSESKERYKHSANIRQSWKPTSTKQQDAAGVCQFCGAPICTGDAICGSCGRSLLGDKCSFCGAHMKVNAKFCTHCGQSREGVTCPQCGTLNSRNFCRKCNTALTPTALKAIEEAKSDKKFQLLLSRAEELAALHARIEELEMSTGKSLSDADRELLDEYADILSSVGSSPTPAVKPRISNTVQEKNEDKSEIEFNFISLDDIMKAYREKVEEMNQALAEMAPPPEYSPEQQRDYYAARKVASLQTTVDMEGYNPTMWKCNLCGCLHNTPPECASPELGGTWVYISPEEYVADNPHLSRSSKLIIN